MFRRFLSTAAAATTRKFKPNRPPPKNSLDRQSREIQSVLDYKERKRFIARADIDIARERDIQEPAKEEPVEEKSIKPVPKILAHTSLNLLKQKTKSLCLQANPDETEFLWHHFQMIQRHGIVDTLIQGMGWLLLGLYFNKEIKNIFNLTEILVGQAVFEPLTVPLSWMREQKLEFTEEIWNELLNHLFSISLTDLSQVNSLFMLIQSHPHPHASYLKLFSQYSSLIPSALIWMRHQGFQRSIFTTLCQWLIQNKTKSEEIIEILKEWQQLKCSHWDRKTLVHLAKIFSVEKEKLSELKMCLHSSDYVACIELMLLHSSSQEVIQAASHLPHFKSIYFQSLFKKIFSCSATFQKLEEEEENNFLFKSLALRAWLRQGELTNEQLVFFKEILHLPVNGNLNQNVENVENDENAENVENVENAQNENLLDFCHSLEKAKLSNDLIHAFYCLTLHFTEFLPCISLFVQKLPSKLSEKSVSFLFAYLERPSQEEAHPRKLLDEMKRLLYRKEDLEQWQDWQLKLKVKVSKQKPDIFIMPSESVPFVAFLERFISITNKEQ